MRECVGVLVFLILSFYVAAPAGAQCQLGVPAIKMGAQGVASGTLASTILTFAAIVGVGAALRASGLLRAEDARPLNAVIIYVGLPAFIFKSVHRADLGPDVWRVVGVAWLVFIVVGLTREVSSITRRCFTSPRFTPSRPR